MPEYLSLYHEEDIPRISSKGAKKRIDGESSLLELCRKNYDKLSSYEQDEIEYNYACILILYYFELGDIENYRKNYSIITKIHPFSKRTNYIRYIILKKKIKKNLNKFKRKDKNE
ncbi:MAG: hypothetical protein IJ809_04790 [Clostridia bacterium]|nr:hypothetical protein [Clostridia bacterium]